MPRVGYITSADSGIGGAIARHRHDVRSLGTPIGPYKPRPIPGLAGPTHERRWKPVPLGGVIPPHLVLPSAARKDCGKLGCRFPRVRVGRPANRTAR